MHASGLGKTVYTQEEIHQKVVEVAQEINRDYDGKELVIVSILKGSIYFVADLTRQLRMPINVDFLSIGARKGENGHSKAVSFIKDLDIDIAGRHVLLVEDVIRTGLTLGYVCQHLESFKPASLKICTLLDNQSERLLNVNIDYRCFVMPGSFVVGYGLDYKERYRNLPYIAEFHR